MLGKLTWEAIPLSQPLPLVASGVVALLVLGVLAWIVIGGHLPYLWREWITSVDHKRIGVMYCALALAMLIRGFSDAILMRTQQALAYQSPGYLPPEHYDQIFSAHGTIMIFFGAMPFIVGLMNFVVPLQLGVRDVAFPTLNSVSFWLTATGALLVNISLVVGEFARTGWWPSPPLSETTYSPGVGVDYYLWAIQISGIGTLLSGVNLVTTILKIRAPGMSYLRMPMFCWTSLASPPPVFNFAVMPRVEGEEAYWTIKQRAREQARLREEPDYEPVEMPLNSPTGFICAFFATLIGFAMIWHIWWLAGFGIAGAFATFVVFAWRDRLEYEIPADRVARINRANRATRMQALENARRRAA
ncbi:cbb3-type cytochrome c oxidase subunit I [Methylobacterium sp. WCS2018Hpa-22]|uniref:cbb3-type cytochrome c oxidase subunit I n=1 Tax=Methylobacterium sp. WCS2018Hpa-22 TaxID=3073633 RepID=UPI002889415B|nr:cbb3-type cytochrome c oxidase subunit I [Methylobacterium sp. WCS2018Hpa-22]